MYWLGNSPASTLLSFEPSARICFSPPTDRGIAVQNGVRVNLNFLNAVLSRDRGARNFFLPLKSWEIHSVAQNADVVLSDEDKKTWDACRLALAAFHFSAEEEDKILGKAFGMVHSPYWGEERKQEVPKYEVVNKILDYLRSLSLSDDELYKLLKKFPEILGCSLEEELKPNVQILGREWGIKGKSLRNLLLRNPKVLGYNVDCKGDCMAQCTRCWVRF